MVIIKLQKYISEFEILTALQDKQTLKTLKWQRSFVVFSNYLHRQQYIQHWTTVKTLLKELSTATFSETSGVKIAEDKTIHDLECIFGGRNGIEIRYMRLL